MPRSALAAASDSAAEPPVARPAEGATISAQQEADSATQMAGLQEAIAAKTATDLKLPIIHPPEDVVRQPGCVEWTRDTSPEGNIRKWRSDPLLETPMFRILQYIDIHDMGFADGEVNTYSSYLKV